jgi:hypothetical protein
MVFARRVQFRQFLVGTCKQLFILDFIGKSNVILIMWNFNFETSFNFDEFNNVLRLIRYCEIGEIKRQHYQL